MLELKLETTYILPSSSGRNCQTDLFIRLSLTHHTVPRLQNRLLFDIVDEVLCTTYRMGSKQPRPCRNEVLIIERPPKRRRRENAWTQADPLQTRCSRSRCHHGPSIIHVFERPSNIDSGYMLGAEHSGAVTYLIDLIHCARIPSRLHRTNFVC